ncbi:MAG: polysaccharide biosynthesis tyrosine autokinase [Burkholderiaceae bacterium]|nr:polysaccharide biosynthesis tyrosine autokinase [Burkholderiaceae bacterium]
MEERRAAPRPANLVRIAGRPSEQALASANARIAAKASATAELGDLVGTLFAQWRWLAIAAVVAGVITAAFAWQLPSKYKATTTLLVETGRAKVLSIEELRASGESREHFQAQAEILQSRDLALRTVRALQLDSAAGFDPRQDNGPMSWLGRLTAASDEQADAAEIENAATERLMKAVRVEATRLSGTIRLTAETIDPSLSARVANRMAELYISTDRDNRSTLSRKVSVQLTERAVELREKLAMSEAELQKYRESVGIVKLGTTQQSMLAQQLNGITERLVTARVRRIELEGAYRRLTAGGQRNYDIGQIQRDPSYTAAKARVDTLALRVAEVTQKYGSAHVLVKEAQAQLKQAREALEASKSALANAIISDYESARLGERELGKLLDAAKAGALDVNRSEPQLAILEREVESNRQLYEMFVKRAKETALAAEVLPAVARIIDAAVPASRASGPPRTQIVLLAAVVAASLMALLILGRSTIDRSLRDRDQAEQSLGRIVLATLPSFSRITDSAAARAYLSVPRSRYAESIRTARVGILLHAQEFASKSVLVTSTMPGEGKTTFACNLALAYSRTRRTLLIDANLRVPQVAARLGMRTDLPGLSNLVSNNEPAKRCFHALPETRLTVLPAGSFHANPQELFMSPRFAAALESIARLFEVVIIDTPATEPASDSVLLASMVPATVVVAESGRASEAHLRRTIGLLGEAGSKVLGVVMNRVGREDRLEPATRDDPEADRGYESLHTAHEPEPFSAPAPTELRNVA